MSGLDKIIEEIRTESDAAVADVLGKAEAEKKSILADADKRAAAEAAKIRADADRKARAVSERTDSAKQLRRRQAILAKKQQLIAETMKMVLDKASLLPDDAYFAALSNMAVKAAHPGKGEIRLCERDLGRLPEGFVTDLAKRLPEGSTLSLSTEPAPIADGLVLVYGGIEENCSFAAMLEDHREEAEDSISKALFS